jgi:ATP-dependent exoDNAse (exonuclease V) beta subunit
MRIQRRLHVPDDLQVRALMEAGYQLRIEGLTHAEDAAHAAVDSETGSAGAGAGATGAADAGAARRGALTAEQELAVARRSEPLLLSAAAGSGKTSVLVERFVRAVREDTLAPGKILAITFTDRAAGELRERVRARLLELDEREAARDTEAAFVGTFHGFCARLLRAHALTAGLEPEFAILDERLAGRLRGEAFTVALRAFMQGERAEAVDLLAAYGAERVQAMILAVHAQLRSRGQRLPRLPAPAPSPMPRLWAGPANGEAQTTGATRQERDGAAGQERDGGPDGQADADGGRGRDDAEAAAACLLLDELLAGFGDAYERLKRERGAVDFDDLELCALALLHEHESVRTAWSARFELLMVDEFQDTNHRQLAILRALDRGNLFTVGDEHQSIYGFRHADVSLLRDRRAELDQRGGALALTRNFRSRAPLLNVVNAVFADRLAAFAPLVAARPDVQAREPLVDLLLTARTGWEGALAEQVAAGLPPAPPWRQAEARMLAQHVRELVDCKGVRPGDVVVLLRALGDVHVYERALQLCGLRTLAAVGAFWEHQQVGDVLAYLRALANPLDEHALYATFASPLVGLSRDSLALLAHAARASGASVWETALRAGEEPAGIPAPERDALQSFCASMVEERAAASRRTIAQLIERAVRAGAYREHVLGLPSGERRLANVYKLLRFARRFEASEGRDLRGFLDLAAHLGDSAGGEAHAPVDAGEPEAVRLMSIHAAKGLEFPVVCVADLGRAPNTRMPDLLVDGDRVGLALVRLDGARATPALDFERLCEERRRAEAEEEDRIMYVAMTRASERLVLSGAVDFERWAQRRHTTTAISWLGPALIADLPALAQAASGQAEVHDLPIGPSGQAHVRVRLNGPASVGEVLDLDAHAAGEAAGSGEAVGSGEAAGPGEAARPIRSTERAPSSMQDVSTMAHTNRNEQHARQPSPPPPEMATLSYTALSEMERCGYRYYLERVLGLGEERAVGAGGSSSAGNGLDARGRGTLVHRLLEGVDFARPSAPSPAQVGQTARELGLRTSASEREEIVALLAAACASAPAARVARAEHVRREHPFAFSPGVPGGPGAAGGPGAGGGPLITGVIDLLAHETDGGYLVLDYKSDRVGPQVDLDALVERDYGIQRLLYALAVLRDGAAGVEVVHWFLERPHEWVSASYAARDRARLQERLAARLRRAQEDPFAVSTHPHRALCLTCPGRAGLCSWSERETLREEPPI